MATLNDSKQYSPDFDGFGIQCAFLGSVAIASTTLFIYIRNKPNYAHLYKNQNGIYNTYNPHLNSKGLKLFMYLLRLPHTEILKHIGLDQYLYCEYLYQISQILGAILFVPIILMPVHYFCSNSDVSGMNQYSIISLPLNSDLYYVHAILVLYLTVVVIYKFHYFMLNFIQLKIIHLKSHSQDLDLRSILIMNIPKEIRTDEALLNYIQSLNIGKVESCFMVRDIAELKSLYVRRKQLIHHLEVAHLKIRHNLVRYFHKDKLKLMAGKYVHMKCLKPQSDSEVSLHSLNSSHTSDQLAELKFKEMRNELTWKDIFEVERTLLDQFHPLHQSHHTHVTNYLVDHILGKLQHVDHQIDQYRRLSYKSSDSAFVTFSNMQSQIIAHQCLPSIQYPLIVFKAPEIRNVNWENLVVRQYNRNIRRFIITAIYLLLTITWLFLMSAVISLTNYQRIIEYIPQLNISPKYTEYIHQIIPTIVVTLCLAVLPYILVGITMIEKLHSFSYVHKVVTKRYFIFSVFNLVVVFTIGRSIFSTILQVVFPANKSVENVGILELLSNNIPNGGFFYINYLILQLNLHFLELIQLNWALVIKWTSELIIRTPRNLIKSQKPYQFLYFYFYPTHALMFMIIIVYSVIHPMIVLVGFLYFVIGYIVFKHQFVFAYKQNYDSHGDVFDYLFKWGIFSLIFLQIIMLSILILRESVGPSCIIGFCLLLTIYYIRGSRFYLRQCDEFPLDECQLSNQDRSVVMMNNVIDTLPVMNHDYTAKSNSKLEPPSQREYPFYIHPLFYKPLSKSILLPERNEVLEVDEYLTSQENVIKQEGFY
eukprot:NODE_268_length_11281_cov_0.363799.p1 type:complete len:819 gc:universal NODE_268_length_11281_cov_0.363799:546-3002(+)